MTADSRAGSAGDATDSDSPAGDGLVTVARVSSSFEAQLLATRLRSAGLEAFVFDAPTAGFGAAFRPGGNEIPVQVPASMAKAARLELESTPGRDGESVPDVVPDSEPHDRPRSESGGMPWPARVGFAVTVLVVAGSILAGIAMLFVG